MSSGMSFEKDTDIKTLKPFVEITWRKEKDKKAD